MRGGCDRDGARAGRRRLPHAALPDARGDLTVIVDARDLDVRAVREAGMRLEQRPDARKLVRVALDDGVRVPDDDGRELDPVNGFLWPDLDLAHVGLVEM